MARHDQSRDCNSLVAVGTIADIGIRWSPEGSVANDPLPKSFPGMRTSVPHNVVGFTGKCSTARGNGREAA